MLKIEDGVDLKELEKFGFKYSEDNEEYYKQNYPERIAIQDKYIYLEYLDNNFWGNIIENDILTTLYDLIQAGLVEKVEED